MPSKLAVNLLAGTAIAISATNISAGTHNPLPGKEIQLVSALESWWAGDAEVAIEKLSKLTQKQPNFKLAQLLYSDMLKAKMGNMGELSVIYDSNDSVDALLLEARQRLAFYSKHQNEINSDKLPSSLLQLGGHFRHAIVVGMDASRLFLYERQDNGQLMLIKSVYAGIGKGGPYKRSEGDNKTPVGIYFNTGFIPDKDLPDLYGAGALPINYPNLLDKKQGKTGSGIWIHGVPTETYSRPPRSSRGCVTIANEDFKTLKSTIDIGNTPVLLLDKINWVTPTDRASQRQAFLDVLNTWKSDWESRDHDAYIKHYHNSFSSMDMPLAVWSDYKRLVNQNKSFIRVSFSDLSLFQDSSGETVVAEFQQHYQSDSFSNSVRKVMYWQKDNKGNWKILAEDIAEDLLAANQH